MQGSWPRSVGGQPHDASWRLIEWDARFAELGGRPYDLAAGLERDLREPKRS
jgi:hypothetical protein